MAAEINIQLNETPAQRVASAHNWHNLAYKSGLMHYFCLEAIYEREYYKELGFNTFEDYAKELWGYTRSTAFHRLKIATKINKSIGVDLNSNQSTIGGLLMGNDPNEPNVLENNHLKNFLGLPYKKQLIIAQFLTQQEFDNLIQTGKARSGHFAKSLNDMQELDRDALKTWAKRKSRSKNEKKHQPLNTLQYFKKLYNHMEKHLNAILDAMHGDPQNIFDLKDKEAIEELFIAVAKIYDKNKNKLELLNGTETKA